jgi:hypothetical protein
MATKSRKPKKKAVKPAKGKKTKTAGATTKADGQDDRQRAREAIDGGLAAIAEADPEGRVAKWQKGTRALEEIEQLDDDQKNLNRSLAAENQRRREESLANADPSVVRKDLRRLYGLVLSNCSAMKQWEAKYGLPFPTTRDDIDLELLAAGRDPRDYDDEGEAMTVIEEAALRRRNAEEFPPAPVGCDAFLLDDQCIEIRGVQFPLGEREDLVVATIVDLGGVASTNDLVTQSGREDAVKVLKRLLKKQGNEQLKLYFRLPGGKGGGSYRTTVKRKPR